MSSSAAKVNDLSWMLGGPQGSGVVSSANVVARACAAGGLHIFGKREFYSNIMGEHSYFALRAHSNLVRSHIDSVNVLATFEAETLFRHAREVTDDGAIVYDPSLGKTRLSDVPTIEKRLYADLKTYLISRGVGETLDDLLAASKQRGVTLLPIPFKDLLEQIADEFKVDQLSKISRVVNMLAVGASFGVLGFDFSTMESALADVFRNKAKIVSMNASGARKAYELAGSLAPDFGYRLERIARKEPRLFLTGSQATALGKLYGGMRFQTYYPITPASDESEFLEENEILDVNGHGLVPEAGGKEKGASMLVVQTEDEIAAVTMATGAALTGARSATATSGPGFSLMMEGIGWASINEVPLVITLYQRAGPSTGMPTRHEQGGLRNAMMEKRFAKLDLASREIPDDVKMAYFGPKDAGTVIVSWGSTKGALLDALDRLWAEGAKIGYLHLRLINPFPVDAVRKFLAKAKRRIGVEMNFGAQLAGVVREHTGIEMTHFIVKYNGRPMSNTELYDALHSVLGGKAEKRTVLTRGA